MIDSEVLSQDKPS